MPLLHEKMAPCYSLISTLSRVGTRSRSTLAVAGVVQGIVEENQPPRIGALRALDASPFLPDITGITHAIRNANKIQRRVVARGLINYLLLLNNNNNKKCRLFSLFFKFYTTNRIVFLENFIIVVISVKKKSATVYIHIYIFINI